MSDFHAAGSLDADPIPSRRPPSTLKSYLRMSHLVHEMAQRLAQGTQTLEIECVEASLARRLDDDEAGVCEHAEML
jgi:hypothetical protein